MPTRVSIRNAISETAWNEQHRLNCLGYRQCWAASPVPIPSLRGRKNETNLLTLGPPIPETGAPPTIIVTPAEPVSAQDFQIHFCSPTPSCSTSFQPYSRLSKFLLRFPGSGREPETNRSRGPIGLGLSTRWPDDKRPIIVYNGYEPYSPISPGELGVIRLPEDEDEFDNEGIFAIRRKERRWSSTKKMRVILFLMLPMLLVSFHLFGAWMGLGFGFGALQTEIYQERDDVFHSNLWEWSPTDTAVTGDLHVPDTLAAEGPIPDLEVAAMTMDVESAPTPVTFVENDTL